MPRRSRNPASTPAMRLRLAGSGAMLLIAAMAASCGPPLDTQGFDSPEPGALLYAIADTARDRDRRHIPDLITALDSADPAVRMLSITTLHELTGTTNGYRHFDPPERRQAAITRWRAWLAENNPPANTSSPDRAPSAPASSP
ncbi:MAG: hypothetical protein ACK55O_01220 [Phycisphaerales bacterium]